MSCSIIRLRGLMALAALLLAASCAPTHAGRTLGKGVLQVEGCYGGPLFKNLGATMPIPNIPVGARYGVTDRVDLASHVNVLPMIMGGFLALDAGATYGIIKHEGRSGPNLASQVGFALLTDFSDGTRVSPTLDLAGGYTLGWFTPFLGAEFVGDVSGERLLGNFYAGSEADIGNLTLAAAGVWFTPWFETYTSSVEYVSPERHGALGFFVGLKYRFDVLGESGDKEVAHD